MPTVSKVINGRSDVSAETRRRVEAAIRERGYRRSSGARSGGIIFPIAKSLAEAYDSRPGETARRLGAFLFPLLYQCEVIIR